MSEKVGIWIIGIYGNISSLVVGGTKKISDGITPIGILTETKEFKDLNLISVDNIVFGGHDIRKGSVQESFKNMCNDIGYHNDIDKKYFDDIENNIRAGTSIGCSKIMSQFSTTPDIDSLPLEDIVNRMARDMKEFKDRNNLRTVIVVNLASTEPPIKNPIQTIQKFTDAIRKNKKELISASIIYAYAAFKNRFPFINFTPSPGVIPSLSQFAEYQDVCYAGNDGKTGETLIKSILSLAFKYRHLKVLAWQSYNMLGNLDGRVLQDPNAKLSKEITKDAVVPKILGYKPYTNVGIDYVPSLNDWKIAMDYIQFEGFLGTKMNMQFTWQGCDSVLAAPLVIDLIRLVELAHRRGEKGALNHLALFFKAPIGTDIIDLAGQWGLLMSHINLD